MTHDYESLVLHDVKVYAFINNALGHVMNALKSHFVYEYFATSVQILRHIGNHKINLTAGTRIILSAFYSKL